MINRQFVMGAGTALWLVMMVQDWYGLEAYIQHLRDHWIDLPWWVDGVMAAWCAWLGLDKAATKSLRNMTDVDFDEIHRGF